VRTAARSEALRSEVVESVSIELRVDCEEVELTDDRRERSVDLSLGVSWLRASTLAAGVALLGDVDVGGLYIAAPVWLGEGLQVG
jgi:hypothetical protein